MRRRQDQIGGDQRAGAEPAVVDVDPANGFEAAQVAAPWVSSSASEPSWPPPPRQKHQRGKKYLHGLTNFAPAPLPPDSDALTALTPAADPDLLSSSAARRAASGSASGTAIATFWPSTSALAEITETTLATPSREGKHRRARRSEIDVAGQDQRLSFACQHLATPPGSTALLPGTAHRRRHPPGRPGAAPGSER